MLYSDNLYLHLGVGTALGGCALIIAERGGTILRQARSGDLPRVDKITIICYTPIQESYVNMLGKECYEAVRHDPHLTWEERKTGQVHRVFGEHPEWLWVLEKEGEILGFISLWLFQEKKYGHIDNNGVDPKYAGQGWGTFMYRHALQYFREQGMRFAHVDTGLDDAHISARHAYEAVGFDREVPTIEFWQDLSKNNPGSSPD